jgi:hypothetical protein
VFFSRIHHQIELGRAARNVTEEPMDGEGDDKGAEEPKKKSSDKAQSKSPAPGAKSPAPGAKGGAKKKK